MAESSDDMLAAIASGNTDELMKLLGGAAQNDGDEPTGDKAKSWQTNVPSTCPSREKPRGDSETPPQGYACGQSNDWSSLGDANEDDLLSEEEKVLREEFRELGPAMEALLSVHSGRIRPTREALTCLRDAERETGFDLDGYSKAVEAWDKEFPSLGGVSRVTEERARVFNDGNVVNQLRVDKLASLFPWVDEEVVQEVLQSSSGSLSSAEKVMKSRYPRPPGWEPLRNVAVASTAVPSVMQHGASTAKGGKGVESWVETGDSVRIMYEQFRAEASDLARLRNQCFVQAAAASAAGNSSASRALARKGRDYNTQMKEKHAFAADAIFRQRNQPGSTTIDLHGLHVAEAIERLGSTLEDLKPGSVRQVLTGSGHHSRGIHNAPRLRPAVERFLRTNKYTFELVADSNKHIGAFRVFV